MEDQVRINRVESALIKWNSNQERLSKLFPASNSFSKALLREKLNNYERIRANFGNSANSDEKITLRLLRDESRNIEKQLYPNILMRLLYRLLIVPMRKQRIILENNRQSNLHIQSLHEVMQRTGFGDLIDKVDLNLNSQKEVFSVPLSYYVNDKERLNHELTFKKDQNGNFQLEGFTSSLLVDSKPQENKQQYFNIRTGYEFDVEQAYNLLSGRAVLKDDNWVQLDLNDQDAQGNYRIKEFKSDYGYDLGAVLKTIPILDRGNKHILDELKSKLTNGSREAVTFLKNGKEQRYFIEANPHFKSVTITDEHSRKVTLATATGQQTAESLKLVHKISDEPNQQKRNSMRII